jgi:hypothetical protein
VIAVFQDLDATLKNVLDDPAAPQTLKDADVSFVTPDKNFSPDGERTVNLFLHEVTENRELRDPVPIVERQGAVFRRRRPPLRVDCAYLVTAWSKKTGGVKVEHEHELLSLTFAWLSRFPTIPPAHFAGGMVEQPFPPPTLVAQMDGAKNTGEFWSALGIAPRPYFSLVVTIAIPLGVSVPEGPPVATKDLRLDPVLRFQIGGTVRSTAAPNDPVKAATVTLVESGESQTTDAEGHFTFSPLKTGSFTLQVTATGYSMKTKGVVVPGMTPEAFDIQLTPAP